MIPRFDTSLGKKLGDIYKMKKNRNIFLDEYGTAVWKLCNGKATVREIGDVLKEQFGEKTEPLYPRLIEFLRTLEKTDLISYKELKSSKK